MVTRSGRFNRSKLLVSKGHNESKELKDLFISLTGFELLARGLEVGRSSLPMERLVD